MYKIPANTLFLGKHLVFMPECHSTNTAALELCQHSSITEGTVVITGHQTAGRGQPGNSWESQPGMNLTFSIVLKPTFLELRHQFLLSIVTSLAVYDYLTGIGASAVRIKWPNDILTQEFKVCGILIENQVVGQQFANVVIGIGLNVNQQQFSSAKATSISVATGKIYDLQDVLEVLLSNLEARYLQLRERKDQHLMNAYLSRLYRRNERHTFRSGSTEFSGEIVGVDAFGRLRVSTETGEKIFATKEISFLY